jgi:hypothetical protein
VSLLAWLLVFSFDSISALRAGRAFGVHIRGWVEEEPYTLKLDWIPRSWYYMETYC